MPEPDYHFLYVDQTLSADWVFVAARRYWERFRPIVTDNYDLIGFIPPDRVVAITTLARRDFSKKLTEEIKQRFPQAYHDPLVYDYVEEMKLTLDGRTNFGQRFGVPEEDPVKPSGSLATVTPSPTPGPSPTPTRTPGKGKK